MTAPAYFDHHYALIPPAGAWTDVSVAFSLAGARRGEVVLCDEAEVVTPRSQLELRTAGAVFKRVSVMHTYRSNYKDHCESIHAWLRV